MVLKLIVVSVIKHVKINGAKTFTKRIIVAKRKCV
jgi:hypothetical protein